MNISNTVPGDIILEFIEEIERLTRERDEVSENIKGIYNDARDDGYDVVAIRGIVAERKKALKDDMKRRAKLAALREYAEAIGQGDLFS